MQIHGRAKLGPAGRLALCQAIEDGVTFRQAAACLNVSPATAHRWWHRYADASLAERHSLAWAADRSSRPDRSPRLSASTGPWDASGRTAWATAHTATAIKPCHTSSSATTRVGRTAGSATGHPSAAFTTYVGRTTRLSGVLPVAPHLGRAALARFVAQTR